MKRLPFFFLLLPTIVLAQLPDSVRKKAIDLQTRSWKAAMDKHYELSVALADSSIALDSTLDDTYTLKSESLWTLKRYKEAADAYKQGMKIHRPFLLVGAYLLTGMLYDKGGCFNEAKEQYALAIKTWDDGYRARNYEETEGMDHIYAYGLMGDTRWKEKLTEWCETHPRWNYQRYESMSRQELLENRFRIYEQ